jgi:Integral peroxisomal membrane peroxin
MYTFVCLDPHLLLALPLATMLLFIMVPAFIARHPPPPPSTSTSSTTPYSEYAYSGPALAPPSTIRPAPETSKDFFRNMRDLQNCMADFSTLHDALVSTITPATNFSDEVRSSTLFLYFSILTTAAFISAQLIPWRFIFLAAGYAFTISSHPTAQLWLMKMQKKAEAKARDALSPTDPSTSLSQSASPLSSLLPLTSHTLAATIHSLSAITLDSPAETREVEIFELQHRPFTSSIPTSSPPPEWAHHLFTPTPFDPLSPARIAGERPKGTRFFDDVQPPPGWEWESKKWLLDLEASEWVAERLIVGVEYDNVHDAPAEDRDGGKVGDFGGWVWDLPPAYGVTREEEMWLAYGDYDLPLPKDENIGQGNKKEKKKEGDKKKVVSRDWEEGMLWDGKGRTGEWRRRRWVRVVKRVRLSGNNEEVMTSLL